MWACNSCRRLYDLHAGLEAICLGLSGFLMDFILNYDYGFLMDNLLNYDGSHDGLWWILWIYDATSDLCFIGDYKHISESMTCGLYRTLFICWFGYFSVDGLDAKLLMLCLFPAHKNYQHITKMLSESISQLVMLWVTMLMITIYISSHIWPDLSGMMKKSLLWSDLMIDEL